MDRDLRWFSRYIIKYNNNRLMGNGKIVPKWHIDGDRVL